MQLFDIMSFLCEKLFSHELKSLYRGNMIVWGSAVPSRNVVDSD